MDTNRHSLQRAICFSFIGLLLAILLPRLIQVPESAKHVRAEQDVLTFKRALWLYELDNHRYPTTEQGLYALVRTPLVKPFASHWRKTGYVNKLSLDPWGNPYQYVSPGRFNADSFDVYSLGPDGFDADVLAYIGNWK